MIIRDLYLLKETPIFELSPGEELNVNLALEKSDRGEEILILMLVLIFNIKNENQYIKKYSRLKIFRQEDLCFPKETKKVLRKKRKKTRKKFFL
ncbi:hypothetical protein ASG98_17185 [Bacillus sp. Soil531]|nr:hypothetical protein ASG98_17185 [Bacillus sp. Soil531]